MRRKALWTLSVIMLISAGMMGGRIDGRVSAAEARTEIQAEAQVQRQSSVRVGEEFENLENLPENGVVTNAAGEMKYYRLTAVEEKSFLLRLEGDTGELLEIRSESGGYLSAVWERTMTVGNGTSYIIGIPAGERMTIKEIPTIKKFEYVSGTIKPFLKDHKIDYNLPSLVGEAPLKFRITYEDGTVELLELGGGANEYGYEVGQGIIYTASGEAVLDEDTITVGTYYPSFYIQGVETILKVPMEVVNLSGLAAGNYFPNNTGSQIVSSQSRMAVTFVPEVSGDYEFFSSEAWIYVCDSEMGEMSGEDDNGGCVWNLRKGKTYYVLFDARQEGFTVSLRLLEADQPQDPQTPETPGGSGTSGEQGSSEGSGAAVPCVHVYETVTRASTCTRAGMTYRECRLCGMVADQKELPLLAHQYQVVVDKKATCGTAGSQHEECAVCHGKGKTTAIPASGQHSFGSYKITKQATALREGSQERSCSVCGKVEGKSVSKLKPFVKSTVRGTVPMKVKQSIRKLPLTMQKGDSVKSWKSSNKKVAVVNSKGKITAKKAGRVKITATLKSGLKKVFTVKVQKGTVKTKTLKISKKMLRMKVKQKIKLTAAVTPYTSQEKVTFLSSNNKVAAVNAKGYVTAKRKGKARITVKSGKKKAVCTVTVK